MGGTRRSHRGTFNYYYIFKFYINVRIYNYIKQLERPFEVPSSGIISDILWSDPNEVLYDGYVTKQSYDITNAASLLL